MHDFFTLFSIENKKLWKRLSSKVMLIILIVVILLATGAVKYAKEHINTINNAPNSIPNTTNVSDNWKESLQQQLNAEKQQLTQMENETALSQRTEIGPLRESIAEDEFRINNDINTETEQSVWTSLTAFEVEARYGSLIALFLIISCSASVAGEFSEGTMKMMVSRPFKRFEILTSKLAAVVVYGLELLAVTFLLNFILIGIFYGFNGLGAKEMLWTGSRILYIPAIIKTLAVFGLDFLTVIVYVIFTFALSAIFRSRSIATGFSLFLLLFVSGIMQILAMFFSWGKYLPFAMTSFSSFIFSGSVIDGTSLPFALILSAIYSIIFCGLGYFVFAKRDI